MSRTVPMTELTCPTIQVNNRSYRALAKESLEVDAAFIVWGL